MKKTAELERIICQFDDYGYDMPIDELQIQAKQALQELLTYLLLLHPERRYSLGNRGHFTYIRNLIPACMALEHKDYLLACHEMLTVFHYEPVLQPRILYALRWVLLKYIGGEEDVSVVQ